MAGWFATASTTVMARLVDWHNVSNQPVASVDSQLKNGSQRCLGACLGYRALVMKTCQSCGGVLGRDCFNPQECAEITRQMQQQACPHCHVDGGHHASFCEASNREVYEVLESEAWEDQWNGVGVYWTEQQAKEEIVRRRKKRRADSKLSDEEFGQWWRWTIQKKTLFGSSR